MLTSIHEHTMLSIVPVYPAFATMPGNTLLSRHTCTPRSMASSRIPATCAAATTLTRTRLDDLFPCCAGALCTHGRPLCCRQPYIVATLPVSEAGIIQISVVLSARSRLDKPMANNMAAEHPTPSLTFLVLLLPNSTLLIFAIIWMVAYENFC